MKDAIKTAKENFKNCSWYGDAGEGLPARHVAPLFAEINQLRNSLDQREAMILHQNTTIEQQQESNSDLLAIAEAIVWHDNRYGKFSNEMYEAARSALKGFKKESVDEK
jgi:hypothetical protein